jgi:hypothetical protein
MSLSARRLNRATLARQLLLGREPLSVAEGVRRVVALQAQEPPSPYLALWNRLAAFDPGELDAAFAERTVVKASLLRLTLHAVHAEDYPPFHAAMLPSLRASRLHDRRFAETRLSIADVDAVLPALVQFLGSPRTVAEIEDMLEARLGAREPRAWWALRTFAPLHHAPSSPTWTFGATPSFVAAGPTEGPGAHDGAVRWVVRRYLEGFGPASVRDVAQFTMLRHPVVRQALHELADGLVRLEGADGTDLFDIPGAPIPGEEAVAPPRLLPMWDSTLLAYADRSRVIPPESRQLVIRRNGDVLPTLLVDGYVAGVWRPVAGGIEATAFHGLDDGAWHGLAEEARALCRFLAAREPTVYRRFARWWRDLPAAEVRMLPGP